MIVVIEKSFAIIIIHTNFGSYIIKNVKERFIMAANVETMFYVREKPWHGLGVKVMEAPTSKDALIVSGLDWKVEQKPIFTETNQLISGYKANVRDIDNKTLGVVSDKYKVIQNDEAFAFTDALLGEGVRYETAGSLKGGKTVWMLARLPQEYIIGGEHICPYLVFSNTHDGSGAVKVAMTPIRVVCSNTLNLCLSTAKRSWSMIHTGDINQKLDEAKNTLFLAQNYMTELGKEFDSLNQKKITDKEIEEYIELLIPMKDNPTSLQEKNILKLREDLRARYYKAPDLKDLGHTAYRFINAVSDFATHSSPLRKNNNYQENVFAKTMNGNPVIDRAYKMLCTA